MSHAPLLHHHERTVIARSAVRTILLLVVTFGLILGAAVPTSLAHATPAPVGSIPVLTDDLESTEEAQSLAASLLITPELPVLQADSSQYVFFATVTNISAQKMPETVLSLFVDTAQVSAVGTTTSTTSAESARPLPSTQVASLEPGKTVDLKITVPAGQFPLNTETSPGVYTLHGILNPANDQPLAAPSEELALAEPTYFTWQGLDSERATAVTFVVPLMLSNSIGVMPSRTQLADEMPRLQALLDAALKSNATLAIDPRILVSIRSFGTAAPASANSFLDALISADLPMFALQFNDADPSAQAALGVTELLAPAGFDFVTRNGTFAAPTTEVRKSEGEETEDENPETETETEDATDIPANDTFDTETENTVPSASELAELPLGYAGAWPAEGQVDQQTLQLLRASGLTSVILDSTNISATATPKVELSDINALVAEATLTDLSTEWVNARTTADRARAASLMLARIAAPANGAQANIVLAFDRGSAATSTELPELITLLLDQPGITATSERDISSSTGALTSAAPLESRIELLRALTARSEEVNALSPLLETPKYLLEYERIRLLGMYATRHAAPEVDFTEVADKIGDRTDELLEGVAPVSTATTQLIGVSSEVPVTLHNNLPFDAQVTLRIDAGSAAIQLENQDSSVITVPARGNALYLVKVNSRVSSGESQLLVDVQDQERHDSYSQIEIQLTLRSAYETVLLTILGISAVTLLTAGIWRSVRRRKSGKPKQTSKISEDLE